MCLLGEIGMKHVLIDAHEKCAFKSQSKFSLAKAGFTLISIFKKLGSETPLNGPYL